MAVIASDQVGAAADLVVDRENGLIVPSRDEEALTAALRFFANEPEVIQRFGAVSRARRNAPSGIRRRPVVPVLPGSAPTSPDDTGGRMRVLLMSSSSGSEGGGEQYLIRL